MADHKMDSEKSIYLDREEHVHKGELGAKRVVGYSYDSTTDTLVPEAPRISYNDFRFDPNDDTPTYIGKNQLLNANTASTNWVLYKFTYSGSDVTRIQKTIDSWDNRGSAF